MKCARGQNRSCLSPASLLNLSYPSGWVLKQQLLAQAKGLSRFLLFYFLKRHQCLFLVFLTPVQALPWRCPGH